MNSDWRAFLESLSAEIGNDSDVTFPAAQTDADCILADLSYLGCIMVDGPDARDFLQGQLTNDVRELSNRHTQLSGYCSPKGRMLANLRLIRLGERFLLQLPRNKVEPVLARLRMFVLRARAELQDLSDELVAVGVAGPGASAELGRFIDPLPELDNGLTQADALTVIRIPGSPPRYEIIGPANAVQEIWLGLAGRATPVASAHWRLLDIRAGLPTIYPETTEVLVPQMANMHLIDGVSFTKGCYTGQEVVARMQYLGRLKRRMYLADVEAATPPNPGDVLYSPDSHSKQATGWVVNAERAGGNRYELLAVVETEAAEQNHVHLGPDGPTLTLKAPPYGFAAAD